MKFTRRAAVASKTRILPDCFEVLFEGREPARGLDFWDEGVIRRAKVTRHVNPRPRATENSECRACQLPILSVKFKISEG
jgi:hypothetical protein